MNKNKKIVLVQIDYSKFGLSNVIPFGIFKVGSFLKKKGYDVKIIHCTELEIKKYVNKIVSEKPLFVGFSVMTGIQTAHSVEMSKKIKEKDSSIIIVWGGIHPSIVLKQTISEPFIDYVVVGEGEITAYNLARYLNKNSKGINPNGLAYKKNGKAIINPKREFIKDLDKFDDDYSLLNMDKYIKNIREYKNVITYKSSRGCPFSCGFCYNLSFNNRMWRAQSDKKVIKNVKYFKNKFDIGGVIFYDDNFYVNKKRATNILNNIKLPTLTDIRIDSVDPQIAKVIRRAGCIDLLIGLESGSQKTLNLIKKGYTVNFMLNKVKILAKEKLRTTYSFIVGFPTEKKEDIKKTMNAIYKVHKIHKEALFTFGLYVPYPGTDLYQLALEHGFKEPKSTYDWKNMERWASFGSPWIDPKWVSNVRETLLFFVLKSKLLHKIAEWRLKHNFFSIPIDSKIVKKLSEKVHRNSMLGRSINNIYSILTSNYKK